MNTDQVTLDQLLAFALLMENNGGILNKAPSYIREKFSFCMSTSVSLSLLGELDSTNRAKFIEWRTRWTSKT